MQELARIIEAGPDPQNDGVVRWRQIDLVGIIKERFGVVCSDSAVANYQSELGFFYISGRPQHPAQDPKIIDGFKKPRQNARCTCSAFTEGQTDRTVVSR